VEKGLQEIKAVTQKLGEVAPIGKPRHAELGEATRGKAFGLRLASPLPHCMVILFHTAISLRIPFGRQILDFVAGTESQYGFT
jgi:hypothetical protein